MITSEQALQIFGAVMNQWAEKATVLVGGMVGYVFRIDTQKSSYILKLYNKINKSETVDDRVYGSNYKNLLPTYDLLVKKGILTPKIYAEGEIEGFTYAVFDFLEGRGVDGEIINYPICADTLAKVHSIQRKYQGWVMNDKPYTVAWSDAFKESLQSRLSGIKDLIDQGLYMKVETFIAKYISDLKDPESFVLSHLDGLQAIFNNTAGSWFLGGVIDIEDYQFTDQRFVLAGITLMQRFGKYKLTEMFWSVYQQRVRIDKTFPQFENLFQIYYLLVWIKVHENDSLEQDECVRVMETIVSLCL